MKFVRRFFAERRRKREERERPKRLKRCYELGYNSLARPTMVSPIRIGWSDEEWDEYDRGLFEAQQERAQKQGQDKS